MREVTRLMGAFTATLADQQEQVEGLAAAVSDVASTVSDGEEQLNKAAARGGTFRSAFIAFVLSAAATLLLLHHITP